MFAGLNRNLYLRRGKSDANGMKRAFMIGSMLLLVLAMRAQRVVVSGTVVDAETREPVAGAHVTMGNVAVVTNDDGFFTIKADSQGELICSHLGYASRRLLPDEQTDSPLVIRLTPAPIQLGEVLVLGGDARDLVLAAIGRIPVNYSRQPELYHCFYREKVMKRQGYISVAEGVADMYKTDYRQSVRHDRTAIRKGRRLMSPKRGDTLTVKVMGGPNVAVQLDVVKNTDILLDEKELDRYNLKMEMPQAIGDRRQYVVSFEPCVTADYALYFGRLYIDQESLAFTRIELELDMRDRNKATQAILVRKPLGLLFRPKEVSFVIDYRTADDGLTRLSYVSSTIRFNCDWRRRLFATSFAAFCEMAVTSTSGGDVQPIKGRDSFDQRDLFYDKVDFFRDPTFWQDYNIIEPSESLDKAIGRLLKNRK